ncbi:hypothetical protein K5X82_00565 [Halosquirtibacter xylanolyticus]|uniref:hypothetical protein n=1 Tax=Halosquirtibacter xylanolyticus TaxID=3374599 RepID=UPI003747BA25|nr:hypothetical protein K5X82_00565 [Prolixibacteraceae bacterium]
MKRALFILLLLPLLTRGQGEESYSKLINETNHLLYIYTDLYPFNNELLNISDLELTQKEENDLISSASKNNSIDLSENNDSISNWYVIGFIQRKIVKRIKQITHHSDFLHSNIRKLLTSDEISIVISDDKKLFNFSIDEKTGGSYRSRLSIMYYTDFKAANPVQEEKFQSFFCSDGYSDIYTLNTKEGVKYVLTNMVRFCSMCFSTSARLISYQDGIFKEEFIHSKESRSWEGGVSYNPETKEIDVSYHLDDMDSSCHCYKNKKTKPGWTESNGSIFNYTCRYSFVFNGSNFEQVDGSLSKVISNNKNISEIMSFKISKNQKEVKLIEYNSNLIYTFLKPNRLVEFSYPYHVDSDNIEFEINQDHETLTFYNGDIIYQVYERFDVLGNKEIGILVTIGNKKYDLKGEPNSLTGTLDDININKINNIRVE